MLLIDLKDLPDMGADNKDRSRSKHQHWVPQFYLRCFATPESRGTKTPQVWIFSKHDEDGDERLTHVRNVCGRRYLYTPVDTDGQRKWDLDDRWGMPRRFWRRSGLSWPRAMSH